ncbi:hypothetical protein VPH35_089045 [Triticum aestivum]
MAFGRFFLCSPGPRDALPLVRTSLVSLPLLSVTLGRACPSPEHGHVAADVPRPPLLAPPINGPPHGLPSAASTSPFPQEPRSPFPEPLEPSLLAIAAMAAAPSGLNSAEAEPPSPFYHHQSSTQSS